MDAIRAVSAFEPSGGDQMLRHVRTNKTGWATGQPFTEDSVGSALAMRDLKERLREQGVAAGGPPPITERDRSRFLGKLDQVVQQGLREARG